MTRFTTPRRHTIEKVRDALASLREQDVVYKVQLDDVHYSLNKAFDQDREEIIASCYFSLPADKREPFNEFFWDLPHAVAHWYGKKFEKTLAACPESAFKDQVTTHRNRWRPLFIELKTMRENQVKGKVPVQKEVVGTRMQRRAICSCCFRQQAVKGDRMVAHGYTLDYGFQNGNCIGAGKPHFGTTEGVQFTQELIRNVLNTAARKRSAVEGAKVGEVKPVERKTGKRIDNPTQHQINMLIHNLESEARMAEFHAEQMQKQVDQWKFVDPVDVEVEITK